VTGIDFNESMLEFARERVGRRDSRHVRLLQMDAADLKFADDSFDIVYAPYLISVVPIRSAWQGRCAASAARAPGDRVESLPQPERCPLAHRAADFSLPRFTLASRRISILPAFLTQAELQPQSIERVNFPKLWSLVTVIK